ILGNYGKAMQFSTLLRDDRRTGSGPSPALARLPGARAVFASEPEQSVQFSEGLIKSLTGGEPILARHLNQDFFEFTPQFKLWLAFNNKPTVRGTDTGIWRRLQLVPFTVTVPKEDRDPHLFDKLKAEASGILNWMLDGYRDWRDKGLAPPEAIVAATEHYREESDPVGGFLQDAIERAPDEHRIQVAALYEIYARWCKANAVRQFSQKAFSIRVRQEFEVVKSSLIFYVGMKLRPEWDVPSGDEPPPPDEPLDDC
ncbi:MAG: phage/plasmid primase, P4 family, partial [Rhodospirillaceae bacterium]